MRLIVHDNRLLDREEMCRVPPLERLNRSKFAAWRRCLYNPDSTHRLSLSISPDPTMPELPEVETTRLGLLPHVRGQRIARVHAVGNIDGRRGRARGKWSMASRARRFLSHAAAVVRRTVARSRVCVLVRSGTKKA